MVYVKVMDSMDSIYDETHCMRFAIPTLICCKADEAVCFAQPGPHPHVLLGMIDPAVLRLMMCRPPLHRLRRDEIE